MIFNRNPLKHSVSAHINISVTGGHYNYYYSIYCDNTFISSVLLNVQSVICAAESLSCKTNRVVWWELFFTVQQLVRDFHDNHVRKYHSLTASLRDRR